MSFGPTMENGLNLKVLDKSVGLCKTTKRKNQLYISLLVSVWRIICENFNPNGLTDVCWLNQQSVRLIIGRSWVQSLAASYQKTLKGGSCCYPVWRSTFERDRATSTWRCSVAAGPTINWAKRISKKDFPFRIFHFGQ